MKKAIYRVIGLAVFLGLVWGGYRYFKQGPEKVSGIATAKVQRGDVVIRAFTRGELKAVRVFPLYAPNLNGTVQVTSLAPMGSLAREKNLVVEYDDSELLASIDGDKLTLDSTDEQIVAAKLNMDITRSQDQVSLLRAKYNVKRGDLNVQQCPVIDLIDCRTYKLQQEQAVRTLAQQQIDVQMLEAQLDSQLAVLQDTRRRSAQMLALDQQRLTTVKTLAPMQGLVAIKQNRGGSFNFGMQMPDIRQGDTLQAGMNVADLLDLSEMALTAKVGEMDRANLKEGQPMTLQLDSIPDKRFPGRIKTLSGTATSDVFSGDPSKKFDVTFTVDMRALLTGLGEKPDVVDRIMNTAAENAKKNLVSFAPTVGGGGRGGGPGGPGGPDVGGFGGGGGGFGGIDPSLLAAVNAAGGRGAGQGAGGGQGGGQGAGGGAQGAGGGQARGGGFGANLSDEDRKKLADIRQKMQNATGDDRDKLQQQMQELIQRAGGGQGRGGGFGANLSDEDRQKLADIRQKMQSATGADRDKLQQQMQELMQRAGGGRGRGGDMGGGQGGGQGRGGDMGGGGQGRGQGGGQGGGQARQFGTMAGVPQFTDEDRTNAKLPPPPEQDSEITALLRPGLLADVEIDVETIPNALHVPKQAVIQKNGQATVYVQANGKWSPRPVKVITQSESMMVLESGVEPGELVALSDPTVNKSEKNKTEEKKSSSATSMMPGGK